jgi:soluble lytic murein transglycosylase
VKSRARLFLIIAGVSIVTFLSWQWRRAHWESSQDKTILAAARKHAVDPALIKGVVWRESRFDPGARGGKGELGLMQIMPKTSHEWTNAQRIGFFSDRMLLDAPKNIDCGTWYLRKLLSRYAHTDNPVPYALADYNAGRGNVLKWIKGSAATNHAEFMQQIGFPSTRDYVRAVMRRRTRYVREFEGRRD